MQSISTTMVSSNEENLKPFKFLTKRQDFQMEVIEKKLKMHNYVVKLYLDQSNIYLLCSVHCAFNILYDQ